MPIALLLFIVMPILEIAILLRVGSAIGWVTTLLIVIVTAVLGSAMLRHQGVTTLNRARERMHSGQMPAQELLEGVMILIGGVLLLTPGFVTDAFGFACLVPVTRKWLAGHLASRAVGGISVVAGGSSTFKQHPGEQSSEPEPGNRPNSAHKSPHRAADQSGRPVRNHRGSVIDGDFQRLDDE